jgi:hypothetical protein
MVVGAAPAPVRAGRALGTLHPRVATQEHPVVIPACVHAPLCARAQPADLRLRVFVISLCTLCVAPACLQSFLRLLEESVRARRCILNDVDAGLLGTRVCRV